MQSLLASEHLLTLSHTLAAMDDLLSTPPRAPALTSPSWISYSPDAPLTPSPTKVPQSRSGSTYTRPKPPQYKAEGTSSLPRIAPPLMGRRSREHEEQEQELTDTSMESEGAWKDVEGDVFGGERFSNVFVLSSSPTSSEGSSEEAAGAPGFSGDEAGTVDSPPTSNASTPINSSVVKPSPFSDAHAMQVDHVEGSFLNAHDVHDERFPFPLPDWCNPYETTLLSPSSATTAIFAAFADDADMTPLPLTPHHLTRQRDAATAAWEAELYATLGSPSPKKSPVIASPSSPRRSRSGATTPRHPFHYSRTSPLHSPHRSPARSRPASLAPGSASNRRRSSTNLSSSSSNSALSPTLHSPIRLQRSLPPIPSTPPISKRSKSKARAAAVKQERQRRRAEEAAANPLLLDMAALDSFFGVTPDAGKASRSGYGNLGLERERGVKGGWKGVSEFQSLLRGGDDGEEEESEEVLKRDSESEGRRRRPPPLDLSRARPRSHSVSTEVDSSDDEAKPMSAQTIATGSPWRGDLRDPLDLGSADPISKEIRRRRSEQGLRSSPSQARGKGKGLNAPTPGLRKKKSVAELFKGLIFGEKGEKMPKDAKGKQRAVEEGYF